MNRNKSLISTLISALVFVLLLALAAGCSDQNSVDTGNIAGTGSNTSLSIKTDNNALDNSPIVIDEAKALITEAELESEPSGVSQHIKIEPFVIHFNMTGAVVSVTSGEIPPGVYSKVKFKIHKPEDNEIPPDPEFREGSSGNQRYSFIVKGRYNGNSFTYKSRKSADLVINLSGSLNFLQGSRNITIVINPSLWFKNGSEIIDPGNSGNDDKIDDNLKNSFKRAFKDDNKDGLPDDN